MLLHRDEKKIMFVLAFQKKSVVIQSNNLERKTTLGPTESVVIAKCRYKNDVIQRFFLQRQREKKKRTDKKLSL